MNRVHSIINFITNQPLQHASGGWCGLSRGIFRALATQANVNFVGPIEPAVYAIEKARSKCLRLLGLRGTFFYFSDRRLREIERKVDAVAPPSDFDLYFGATPWVKCDRGKPYACMVDAIFPTYLRIFGEPSQFAVADLERIKRNEETWLAKARHIFWASDWARRDAEVYGELDGVAGTITGIGGNVDPPQQITYSGEKRLIFISRRFAEKGGREAFHAFSRVYERYAELRLVIIGDRPPGEVLQHPGVEYAGFLDKRNPQQLDRFKTELSRAMCLVHPTRMDTMGHVLIEAAYWGCPSVAPARFGIPEIIEDGRTGLLLPDPFTIVDIAQRLEWMLRHSDAYREMRIMARKNALSRFTYDVIAKQILQTIHSCLHG